MELRDYSDRSPEQQTTYSNDPALRSETLDIVPNSSSGSVDTLRFRIDKTAQKGAAVNGRRCNLDCIWCHNDYFSNGKFTAISNKEIIRILQSVIRVSGTNHALARIAGNGEPTLAGVEEQCDLIQALHKLPEIRRVSMTSNGVLLKSMLPRLVESGLNSLTISLNALSPSKFKDYSGRDKFQQVVESLRVASRLEIGLKVNLIYTRLIKDELAALQNFSSEFGGLTIKIFDLLPNAKTSHLYEPLDRLKQSLLQTANTYEASEYPYQQDKFTMSNGTVFILKNAEQINPCPNTQCKVRHLCLEGCRHSIRIGMDGSIQPCGIRIDNKLDSANVFPSDKQIYDALLSGGKLPTIIENRKVEEHER